MTALSHLILHPHASKSDRGKILSGTDARTIIAGDWLELWKQKTGVIAAPDLTHVWKPALGTYTEPFHCAWHGRTEEVDLTQLPDRPHTTAEAMALRPYMAATYDRWVMPHDVPLEVKHTNERNNLRDAATYYMPQLQQQMRVAGVGELRFSIIRGNEEPVWGRVDYDPEYFKMLLDQLDAFWWYIDTGHAPPPKDSGAGFGNFSSAEAATEAFAGAANGVKINGMKPYDLTTNNEWVDKATRYVAEKPIADGFKTLEKELRALIPADASSVIGGGISVKRDARGANRITIDEPAS